MSFLQTTRARWVFAIFGVLAVVAGVAFSFRHWETWAATTGSHDANPAEEHDHEHESPGISLTAYSAELEVFADVSVPAAGETATAYVHVTLLESGLPLKSGTLDFRAASQSGHQIAASSPGPKQPGIFELELAVAQSGHGHYRASVEINSPELPTSPAQVDLPVFVLGDTHLDGGRSPDVHDAEHEPHDERADEDSGDISFLKEQQWRIPMRTMVVSRQDISKTLQVPATIIAPHPSEALVPPPIAGYVAAPPDATLPHAGDVISKGQLLAVIKPAVLGSDAAQLAVQRVVNRAQLQTIESEMAAKQLEAEADSHGAELELQLAQTNYDRLKQLTDSGVTAGKNFLEAQFALNRAETRLRGLQQLIKAYGEARNRLNESINADPMTAASSAEDRSLFVELRSPINGTIVDSGATAGEFVDNEHPLFRIVNLDRLFIEARVSEYDLAKIESSKMAHYRSAAYPNRWVPILGDGGGRLVFIGAVVDPLSRTVPVRYEVPNADGKLRLNMYADVKIATEHRADVITLPADAIVDDAGESVVYIQTGGESFARQPVQLGVRGTDRVEIVDGLRTGQRVVVNGGYLIRLSTLTGGGPQHHHH